MFFTCNTCRLHTHRSLWLFLAYVRQIVNFSRASTLYEFRIRLFSRCFAFACSSSRLGLDFALFIFLFFVTFTGFFEVLIVFGYHPCLCFGARFRKMLYWKRQLSLNKLRCIFVDLLEKLLYSFISSWVGWYASANSNCSWVLITTYSFSVSSSSSLSAMTVFKSSYSLFWIV